MLEVVPDLPVAEAARLMTEQDAASVRVVADESRQLAYEDVIRGLRRAREGLTMSALAADDCPASDPMPGPTASVASDPAPRAAEASAPPSFEPDTLLPSQYADRARRGAQFEPERRLMIAVLQLAIDDYTKYVTARDRRGKVLFEEAEAWIEDRDAGWPFAFQSICDALDLDADYLRQGLHAWKERTAARPAAVPGGAAAAAAGEGASPRREAG